MPTESGFIEHAADVYLASFDPDSSESVSIDVVAAVAAASGKCIDEVGPLFDVVNPDALDGLFGVRREEEGLMPSSVTFQLDEFRVTVRSHGAIELRKTRDEAT